MMTQGNRSNNTSQKKQVNSLVTIDGIVTNPLWLTRQKYFVITLDRALGLLA
jgi:hypothetical protein